MQFTIWTEKRPEKGEDAPPTLLTNASKSKGVLVVYDGLGGAGSKLYEYEDENNEPHQHTGAYLAARFAKKETENFFEAEFLAETNAMVPIADLKEQLIEEFAEKIKILDINPSKLRSKLIKRLPTTIAGMYYEQETVSVIRITSFWAGDSRRYLLTASGLKQLSSDDLNGEPDALENLLMDATISNCINADGLFELNVSQLTVNEPVILITATDGCFGYVKSPAHFEQLLLKTLVQSQYDVEAWKELLEESIAAIAGDDFSMSVQLLGMKTLEDWKIYLYERYKYLQTHFVSPLEEAEEKIAILEKQEGFLPVEIEKLEEQKRALREHLWEQYKEGYYLNFSEE